jgi:hypothetical protein
MEPIMSCSVRLNVQHKFSFLIVAFAGGGFEGDMILPEGFDPTSEADGRGVAIFGPRRWPNNLVPYDISGITGKIANRNEPF